MVQGEILIAFYNTVWTEINIEVLLLCWIVMLLFKRKGPRCCILWRQVDFLLSVLLFPCAEEWEKRKRKRRRNKKNKKEKRALFAWRKGRDWMKNSVLPRQPFSSVASVLCQDCHTVIAPLFWSWRLSKTRIF